MSAYERDVMESGKRTVEINSAIHQRVDAAVSWTKRAVRVLSTDNARIAWTLYRRQNDMIFPGRLTQGKGSAWVDAPDGAQMLRFPSSDGHHVAAIFGSALKEDGSPHPTPQDQPTIIYFYAGEMTVKTSLEAFQVLRSGGMNVLMPEYIGYGLSSGTASEAGCYATADAAYEHLLGRPDIDRSRVVAVGSALGGAVALDLAARRTMSGIITLGAFTSMRELIARNYPDLPTVGLLKHHFDAAEKIARVDWPTLVIHSRDDATVPNEMAEKLEAAARPPIQRIDLYGDTPGQFLIYRDSDAFRAIRDYATALSPVMPAREEAIGTASVFTLGGSRNLFTHARDRDVRAAG